MIVKRLGQEEWRAGWSWRLGLLGLSSTAPKGTSICFLAALALDICPQAHTCTMTCIALRVAFKKLSLAVQRLPLKPKATDKAPSSWDTDGEVNLCHYALRSLSDPSWNLKPEIMPSLQGSPSAPLGCCKSWLSYSMAAGRSPWLMLTDTPLWH